MGCGLLFAFGIAAAVLAPLAVSVEIPKCVALDVVGVKGWLFSFRSLLRNGLSSAAADRAPGASDLLTKIKTKPGSKIGVLSNLFDGADAVRAVFNKATLQSVDDFYTADEAIVKNAARAAKDTKFLLLLNRGFNFEQKLKGKVQDSIIKDSWEFKKTLTLDEAYEWANLSLLKTKPVVVVAAFNHYPEKPKLDYELSKVVNILLRNGAKFLVGAPDSSRYDPTTKKYIPSLGAFEALHLRSAEIQKTAPPAVYENTGKGGNAGSIMFTTQLSNLNVQPTDTVMVGDSLMTDIVGAKGANLKKAILVLGGLNTKEDAEKSTDTLSDPNCYVNDLTELAGLIG